MASGRSAGAGEGEIKVLCWGNLDLLRTFSSTPSTWELQKDIF